MAFLDTEGIDTTTTTSADSELTQWLKENNLDQVISTFEKEHMTMEELMEYGEEPDALKQYLSELGIPSASISRICFKIKRKLKSNKSGDMKPNVVIVITQKEQDSMDKLYERSKNITSLIQQLSQQKEQILHNEQTVHSQINAEYNNLTNLIANNQKTMLTKLTQISNSKQMKITAISQQLEAEQKNTKHAIKSCNEFVQNINIERNVRQNKIMSIVDAVINDEIPQNIPVSADIFFEFNKERISSSISNFADVFAETNAVVIIEDIHCKPTRTECTIEWKAGICGQDFDRKIRGKLYMKIRNINKEIDEKEKDQLDSDFIVFNANKTHYQYKMSDLQKDTLYQMKICLFEATANNNIMERNDVKPVLFHFETSSSEFLEKAFIYESDYDENGILYFLGTNYGKQVWQNPAKRGLVTLNSSKWGHGSINDMVGRTYTLSYSSNIEGAWVTIDFGDKLKIKANAYTLQYSNTEGGLKCYLRNWNFEGSNDGSKWSIIKKHANDTTFTKNQESHTWVLTDCNEYYQYFRLKMTGKTVDGHWFFTYTMLEMYGYVTGNK